MKALRRLLLACLAVAALVGHIVFWYLPRDRAATVDASSGAGALYTSGGQEVRVWLAFPHQNAGAAARAMDDPAAAVKAAARLAGLGDVDLPAFGPFALPPARALAIAVDRGGGGLEVAVDVYPSIALLARLAGLVAGNPVLWGGVVERGGRRLRVEWHGRSWSIRDAGSPRAAPRRRAPPPGAGLGFLTLDGELGPAVPGTYRLSLEGRDLVLSSTGAAAWAATAALVETRARERELAFLGLRVDDPSSISMLFLPRSEARELSLPDAAVAWMGRGQRWVLPGERILRLLHLDPIRARSGQWEILAMEPASAEVASALAPELGAAARRARASLLVWARPRDYLPLVSAIARALDALPIAPRDEARRWRDLETLLRSIGAVDRVQVTVAAGGGEARLRLAPDRRPAGGSPSRS